MNQAEGATLIGKSVVIRGEVSGEEDLIMDGNIEGTITLTGSRLTVGPNAKVVGNLSARDIVIFGSLKGNIRAVGRVDLRQTAVVNGDILASRLSIEENAMLKGHVELSTPSATSSTGSAQSATSKQTPNPATPGQPA